MRVNSRNGVDPFLFYKNVKKMDKNLQEIQDSFNRMKNEVKLPEGTIINPPKPSELYQEVKLPNALPNQPVSAEVKPFPIDTAIIPDTLKQ